MGKHRSDYKSYKAGKRRYITSFEILKFDDAYIGLIENHSCLCREQLERCEFEGGHIRSEPNAANKIIVGRTYKEWREEKDTQACASTIHLRLARVGLNQIANK